MKIALLCPTRLRPQNMESFWLSAVNTAKQKNNLIVVFRIDNDDEVSLKKCQELQKHFNTFQVRYIQVGRNPSLGKLTNDCLYMLEKDDEVIHFSGDDLLFRTEGWDEQVRSTFAKYPDRLCCAYGSDLYISDNQRFGTHPFISRKHVDILGYAATPLFVGSYLDTWTNRLYDIINRKVKLPIVIEHMHPVTGKASYDAVMMEKFERERQQNSGTLFYEKFPEIVTDAKKLWNYIQHES